MPITKTTGYKASDGQVYETVEEAQVVEVKDLFDVATTGTVQNATWTVDEIAKHIVQRSDSILDILTTGPRSRPSTRKKAGTTAPKRARARAATATEVSEGLKAMREAVDAPLAAAS